MTPFRGTLWSNNGRYWWRVKLPGATRRQAIPLRDPATGFVTPSPSRAEQLAQKLWDEAERKGGSLELTSRACSVKRLRAMWLADLPEERRSEAETNTALLSEMRQPADTVRAKDILAMQSAMKRGGLAVRTINRRIAAIGRVFDFGAARDIVPGDLAHGIRSIAPLRGEKRSFGLPDIAAVQQTLERCPPTLWRMVMVQWIVGLRSSELCRIRREDVHQDGEDLVLTIQRHKTQRTIGTKTIVLGPRVLELIEPLLVKAPGEYLFSPREAELERGRENAAAGECYTKDSYARAIGRARRAGGAVHWHPHQLRHLAATEIADRMTEEHSRATMGHTSAAMTRTYIHEQRRKARAVAEEMG